MEKLSSILSIYKEKEVDDFIKDFSGYNLNEKRINYSSIKTHWKFLGDNESNGSTVNMLRVGEKGLVERITNAIDAVIEKQKEKNHIISAKDSEAVIKKAFPQFHENNMGIMNGNGSQLNVKDAYDQVTLVVNDGSKSNKPTFDVIDKGTGIEGNEFKNTILSIARGNKLSKEKSYLIGAFGQGGSTSIAFTYSTMIVSKKENRYFYTVIKAVDLEEYKNIVYVYLTNEDGSIPEAAFDDYTNNPHLDEFINSESGTLVRMIETDITKRFRDNEVTKPGMLVDYINSELFNVGLPVKVVDYRESYRINSSSQNRYAYGSYLKLQTSKYLQKDYCGSIDIEHNGRSYKIEYFVVLPKDQEKWGRESACKTVFEQFNVSYNPIIYTVNGQMITSEGYTKLNNAGLNFLKYRLLVVIDLDVLGTEKYKFFTSDRSRIQSTDLTRGFLDKVIVALANVEKLKEINSIIADKSISSTIDKEFLDEVSKEVKNQYSKYLKSGTLLPGHRSHVVNPTPPEEEVYEDKIEGIEIISKTVSYYSDQRITFVLRTGAQKHINQSAAIYMYIDGKGYYSFTRIAMNGRIQYTIPSGKLESGNHSVQFEYYSNMQGSVSIRSNEKEFTILEEKTPETSKQLERSLDLSIEIKDEATLICEVVKETVTKKVIVYLCFDTDELRSEVYGLQRSADEIATIKNKLIKPVALFGLFYSDSYERIETEEEKNRLMLTFIKSFVLTA